MATRARTPTPSPSGIYRELEDLRSENRRLHNDLFVARDRLISLMDQQDLLHGYYRIRDRKQLAEWRQETAATVLSKALVRPGAEMGDPRWPRALCPLCRGGAQGARDVRGYAVPEGLRRHLLGEMNSQQCPVFSAAEGIARESIRDAESGRPQVAWD
ncbi:hypothetical protein QF000_006644 [Paraburkholderia atlantica]